MEENIKETELYQAELSSKVMNEIDEEFYRMSYHYSNRNLDRSCFDGIVNRIAEEKRKIEGIAALYLSQGQKMSGFCIDMLKFLDGMVQDISEANLDNDDWYDNFLSDSEEVRTACFYEIDKAKQEGRY